MIRNISLKDFSHLRPFLKGLYSETGWQLSSLESCLAKPGYHLIFTSLNEILGFLFCQSLTNEPEILYFFVTPFARGKGVGRALLSQTQQYFMQPHLKIKSIWLEVRISNIAARTLYESSGFQLRYTRKDYYPAPASNTSLSTEDACVYEFPIKKNPLIP